MEGSEEEGGRLRYSKKEQGAIKKKERIERKEEGREDEMEVDMNMRMELEKLKKELERYGKKVEEYRGVTLTATLYKIYAGMLAERLRTDVEEKGIVPDNQVGFKKGKGTIDNVYELNFIVNRNLEKRGGKIMAFFVDLRAAFDTMDRELLKRAMRDRGMREGLINRCIDLYTETRIRMRSGEEIGREF